MYMTAGWVRWEPNLKIVISTQITWVLTDRMSHRHRRSRSRHRANNWKPWQTSVSLLLPMLLFGVVLMPVLVTHAYRSTRRMSASIFEHEWLAWYINTTKDSSADTQRLKDIPLDFNASADCLQGFVNLSSSSSQTYFTWNYLPSIISGLFAILWGLVDSEVKRIGPFYQASRPNGASARSVLFSEYITFPSFLSIFQAVWWLQWTPFLSALCMVLMAVTSPVLQAFIFQSRGQLLEIGVLSDATGLSAGEKFQPFGADYLISDYFSNARNVTGIHLVGRCITDEALVDNYYSNSTIYQRSSVHAYMYVGYTVGIAQGIIYLVVSLLGGLL